jgi:hypothetical protein
MNGAGGAMAAVDLVAGRLLDLIPAVESKLFVLVRKCVQIERPQDSPEHTSGPRIRKKTER